MSETEDKEDNRRDKKQDNKQHKALNCAALPSDRATPPGLTIDWDLYGQYLQDSDMSDDQKRELIETLWSIVVSFVDLGLNIHPLQQVSGQDSELATFIANQAEDMIKLPSTQTNLE